jgi:hypothetical protein
MHNSKLINTLNSLNKSTLNRLKKFISSPYHNPNLTIQQLFLYLFENLENPDTYSLDRLTIWEQLHQKEAFNYPRLRKYFTECIKLVEEFLIIDHFRDNQVLKVENFLDLARQTKNKFIEDLAIKRYNAFDKYSYDESSYSYLNKFLIERNIFLLTNYDVKRYSNTNISDILKYLDVFYISEKLRYVSDILSRNWETENIDLLLFDEILSLLKDKPKLLNFPSIAMYYYIFNSIKEPHSDNNYEQLRFNLKQNSLMFPATEAKTFYEAAVSYCIAKMNSGDMSYLRELFLLYKDFIDTGFIFVDNQIDPYNYKNIVTAGLRLKEYDWVEYFIENYASNIQNEFRENAYTYNLAQLHFYKGDYDKVLRLLQEVEYDDLTYNLGSKSMLMAIYYETDEIEPLLSLIDSFKVYLNRQKNKIPAGTIKNYFNLLKFCKKLISIPPGNKEALNQLKKEIDQTKGIASEKWLREKIDELY